MDFTNVSSDVKKNRTTLKLMVLEMRVDFIFEHEKQVTLMSVPILLRFEISLKY
jgi:hypothetical protein